MRRRTKPNRLRKDRHRAIVLVFGFVIQRDANRHEATLFEHYDDQFWDFVHRRLAMAAHFAGHCVSGNALAAGHYGSREACAQPLPTNRASTDPNLSKADHFRR